MAADSKEGKLSFVIPININDIIDHIKNYCFLLEFAAKTSSCSYKKNKSGLKKLKHNKLHLDQLYLVVEDLPIKIMTFIYSKN